MKALTTTVRIALFLFCIWLPLAAWCQVNESFGDGDFTQSPPWTGDVGDFEINATQQLHLVSVGTDTSALSTPNAMLDDTEWHGWFRLSFAASDNNYMRLYLVSDQTDLKHALNGYFLRYGENGSAEGLDLWRQDGTTLTKIIDGTPNAGAASSNQQIRFKATRSATGDWQLWADYSGGYAYQLLGTITDNTHTSTLACGMWCKYTSTNASGFYWDDVYAGPVVIDNTPPTIINITALSVDTVTVQFSEPITQASAAILTNYAINGGIGNPATVSYSASLPDRVTLGLATPLLPEQSYQLTVGSMEDFAGNVSASFSGSLLFYAPTAFDVVISEIMADPSPVVGLPDAEYVELYNTRSIPINVAGWKLKVGNTVRTIPSGTIPADSFLLLTTTPLPIEFSAINAVAVPSFLALTNSGATVSLLSPADVLIHGVTYDVAWYQDAQKDDGGWSLEMKNPTAVCNGADNWGASQNGMGGTPGYQNSIHDNGSVSFGLVSATASGPLWVDVSFTQFPDVGTLSSSAFYVNPGVGNPDSVTLLSNTSGRLYFSSAFAQQTVYQLTVSATVLNCMQQPLTGNLSLPFTYYVPTPNDVIITEIMADPTPLVGLPDAEYVELYNRTDFPIDITGWKLQSGSSVRVIPSGTIPADSFLLLTVDPLPTSYSVLNAVAVPSFPALSNSGGTVTLYSPADEIMQRITYDISWYNDGVKDDGGWSLELINPDNLCGGAENWTACQYFFGGTPGTTNSVNHAQPVPFAPVSATAVSASVADVYFSQTVDTALVSPAVFQVNQGVGMPDSVRLVAPAVCRLYFSSVFSSQTVYEVTVAAPFSNCAQEPVSGSATVPFTFYTPKQNDVILTEILADESPSQGLPLFEYIELYNRAPLPIQLAGWQFSAGNTTVPLPAYLLPPGAYVTLTVPEAENLFAGNVLAVPSFPPLTNSGASLLLANTEGDQIHSVAYTDAWYTEAVKRDGGWALEMMDVNNPCAGGENWAASVHINGGTPGTENSVKHTNTDSQRPFPMRVGIPSADSLLLYFYEPLNISSVTPARFSINEGIGQPVAVMVEEPGLSIVALKLSQFLQPGVLYTITCTDSITDCVGNRLEIKSAMRFRLPDAPMAGDVILNEVLFDPKGDGRDYIELYNRSVHALDLRKLYLGNYDSAAQQLTDAQVLSTRPAIWMPGTYLLLSTDRADIYHRYFTEDPTAFWDIPSLPSMANTGGSVAVSDDNFVLLDAFTFTDAFHFSLLDNKDGVSLERIHPQGQTQSVYNWTSAAASVGYGTPGYKNSQWGMATEQDAAVTVSPEIFSPDQDGFDDVLFIDHQFPEPGNVVSVTIYDELGRLVKKLVNAEYCGSTGQYTWDGGTDNGLHPKVGIYVVMVEWFNASGNKGRAKKTVVLATRL